jgi:LysM repeat protein
MSPLAADLPPTLPTELHASVLTENSRPTTRSHEVVPGDTLYDLAERYRTSVPTLLKYNDLPHGGRWLLPGTVVEIPVKPGSGDSSDNHKGNGSSAGGSSTGGSSSGSASSGSATSGGKKVTVRPGDTLSHLSLRYDVSVSSIVKANGLSSPRMIHAGQTLVIPGKDGGSGSSSGSSGSSGSTSSGSSSAAKSSPDSGGSTGTVTVRQGDTLSHIAARHDVALSEVLAANKGLDPQRLWVGQKVKVPGLTPTVATPDNIGDRKKGEDVDDTFLHYTYPEDVARAAAANREHLAQADVPSRDQVRRMVTETAQRHGVDPALMLALSTMESGWNHRAVSPANAIGVMQVIPSSGEWASSLVGRELNLLDPQDNITAGTVIMRALLRSAENEKLAIGGYYQGLAGVQQNGMYPDTKHYVKTIQALRKQM